MDGRRRLQVLFAEVERRTAALSGAHRGWPCARGCGACCRSLARVPELTRAEWELVRDALAALPEEERTACSEGARALARAVRVRGREQRCQCPLFDPVRQTCRVYAARPLACRSYGFYAGRSHDAWCELVADHVAQVRGALVFGNLDALERELTRAAGERRSLLDWLGLAPGAGEAPDRT